MLAWTLEVVVCLDTLGNSFTYRKQNVYHLSHEFPIQDGATCMRLDCGRNITQLIFFCGPRVGTLRKSNF